MGKPSSTRVSKSEMSLHSLTKLNVIQAKNEIKKTKRNRNNRKNRVNKKFDKLIGNLQLSLGISTVSLNSTVIEQDVPSNKRKDISTESDSPRKKSRQSISATSIVINDDEENSVGHCSKQKIKPPLHSSTPIKYLIKNLPDSVANKKDVAILNKVNKNKNNTLVTIDLSEDGDPAIMKEPENGVVNLNCDEDKKTDLDCVFVTENKKITSNEVEEKEISDCVLVSENNEIVIPKEAGDKEISDCVLVFDNNKTVISKEVGDKEISDCVLVFDNNKTVISKEVGDKEISDCVLVSENNKIVIPKEAGDKEISDCAFVSEINDSIDRSNEVKENEVSRCVFIADDRDRDSDLESGEIGETSDSDCVFVSAHNSTDSDHSDVTIIPNPKNLQDRRIKRVVRGLAKLDESAKDKLLKLITQNIFSGCKKPKNYKNLTRRVPIDVSVQATEDDVYIKEVILGQSLSGNSVGSNIYNPAHVKRRTGLRMVVIDGSNVAMSHGQHRFFSVNGLKICIDYFTRRGHAVKAFVPRFRCKFGKSTNPRLLDFLENQGLVVYTPSREIQGRQITSYDDRYIIQCAAEFDGVIVSGDNYRDLIHENPKWRFVIENRLLPFTFVNDMIMFPKDPLGRNGPSLQKLLRH